MIFYFQSGNKRGSTLRRNKVAIRRVNNIFQFFFTSTPLHVDKWFQYTESWMRVEKNRQSPILNGLSENPLITDRNKAKTTFNVSSVLLQGLRHTRRGRFNISCVINICYILLLVSVFSLFDYSPIFFINLKLIFGSSVDICNVHFVVWE